MKLQNEDQKLTEIQTKAKKPRFKIEKLEERIAPHHRFRHHSLGGANGHGAGGSGGHCGHGACN